MPFRAVDKHADNLLQVEALFFGQAGLLEEDSVPSYYQEELKKDEYFQSLKKEYKFLAHKFDLRPMDYTMWRLLGMTAGFVFGKGTRRKGNFLFTECSLFVLW